MVQICHEMINQEGFQYPSLRHLTNFIYRKKLFEIVYSPKLICGNCRIARLVDRDLLFTVAARLINFPTTQTLETKPSVKLKKPMPKLYVRIRPKKDAKIYVQSSKRRMKNAMKQNFLRCQQQINNQQSTVSPQITSRHATTSISPNLSPSIFCLQETFPNLLGVDLHELLPPAKVDQRCC